MSMLYADSSALLGAYFVDEEEHPELETLLFESGNTVITSELARVELASAVRSAARAFRVRDEVALHDRIDLDFADGHVTLIELDPPTILPAAHRLVRQHRLRTLDAIHLAVALEDAPHYADGDEVVLVTRDADQAAAARALGLAVR